MGGVGVPGSRAEAFVAQLHSKREQLETNHLPETSPAKKEKETDIVKKHSSGTRKIANLIAERGGEAVRDDEGTMGWGSGGRGRRSKKSCRIIHVRFHP